MPDASPLVSAHESLPLQVLFVDFNSYFASVEQQEDPSLRGRPVGVGAVMTESGTIVAASYEAKAFGVRTGTLVGQANELCPGIVLLPVRSTLYVHYHQRLIDACESVLPVEKVCSIDEMRFRLIGAEREPDEARRLALRMKEAVAERVGTCMTCSIGIAPNAFLAKLGTEIEKLNGLVVLEAADLPGRLLELGLTDFTGINRRMRARLEAAGIFDAQDLWNADRNKLRSAFGGVVGERWWYLLRGHDVGPDSNDRRSLGHSHVLPPELRNDEGCWEVLVRLTSKACARLRASGLWAGHVTVHVSGRVKSWTAKSKLPPTHETVAVVNTLRNLWQNRDFERPVTIGVTFHALSEHGAYTPSLFETASDAEALDREVDRLNKQFGKNSVYLAGQHRARDAATEKIAFQKTTLFQEGKGDGEYKPPGS